MGFRFQRRIKILPGIYLNASKSGLSVSAKAGPLTVNSRGTATVGAHGTGASYRHDFAAEERKEQRRLAREERKAEREYDQQFPSIDEQIDFLQDFFLDGADSIGYTLWRQHGIGLVGLLLNHEQTPREIREHCSAIESWDRIEVQLLRCQSRQEADQTVGNLIDSLKAVNAFAEEVGLYKAED